MKPSANPVEDAPQGSGINVKQLMLIGAVTALTGTVVGAVATELYRYFRPKVPIPQPSPPGSEQVVPNPGMFALPGGGSPPQPYAIHQVGSFPQPIAPNPYASMPMALPTTTTPALPPSPPAYDPEPLSRPELAQWQRRLENWQRDLERRESFERDTRRD